ncbi:MAG: ABC transporter permease [Armatimonadota bacterium]
MQIKWLKLAIKNMVRRPTRTLLAMLGVAIAVSVLFSLIQFQRGYERGLRSELGQLGAHIMVVPRGCPYEAATIVLHGGKWPRYMDHEWYKLIKDTPGISHSAPVIMDAIIRDGGKENLIYMGIDENYPSLRASWDYASGGWFDQADSIILGKGAAEKENVQVGDTLVVEDGSRIKPTRVRVAGILQRTNTQDDGLYFLPMQTLQRVFNLEGKIVVVLVKVADVAQVDKIAEVLRERARESDASMNVFPLSELLGTLQSLLANTRVFVLAIVAVALLIGGVGVLNTIMMTVYERTAEIGMLKAMGASGRDVFRLISLETFFTCIAGGVTGIGVAVVSSRAVAALLVKVLPHVPDNFSISFDWDTVALCLGVAAFLGLVAGLYPAHRASAVSPITAIRGGQ